jgi:MFS family permease
MAGWVAPLLLCLLRFGQGFGLGGEWGGAALLAVENAPAGLKARFGMFPQLGAPVGFFIANGLFLALTRVLSLDEFKAWGWRLPFITSFVLVGVGLWVRLKLTETPAFARALEEAPPSTVPMAEALKRHPLEVLAGMFAAVAVFATYYVNTAFALGYGVGTLRYSFTEFLAVQVGAIGFMALGTLLAASWADRGDIRRVLAGACMFGVAASFLLAPMLSSGSLVLIWLYESIGMFAMGLMYGPLSAFLTSLFPARVRYSGCSIAFNIAGVLGGGLTPVIAVSLAAQQGGLGLVGYYLGGAAMVSLLAMIPLRRRYD